MGLLRVFSRVLFVVEDVITYNSSFELKLHKEIFARHLSNRNYRSLYILFSSLINRAYRSAVYQALHSTSYRYLSAQKLALDL